MRRTASGWKCDECGAQIAGPMSAVYAHDCRPPRPTAPENPSAGSAKTIEERRQFVRSRLADKAALGLLTIPIEEAQARADRCLSLPCSARCPRFPGCDGRERWIDFLAGIPEPEDCARWRQ